MKLGLIADIHGDLGRLLRAFTLLDKHGVDRILCAGDLVDGEPYGNGVIDHLQQRGIPCALGNHDETAANQQRYRLESLMPYGGAPLPDRTSLQSENISYLLTLPKAHMFEVNNKWLYLVHATPWSSSVHVFSHSSRSLLQQVVKQSASDYVVFGHTHEPMRAYIDGTWLFNPGSVHLNRFEKTHTCAILTLPDLTYSVFDIETGKPQRIPFIK
jgi:putative phosphoesterase